MIPIDYLRQARIGEYAIFDFVVAFYGMALLTPLLSMLFLKIRISIPKRNFIFLTLPISIVVHVLAGNITPMTADFLDLEENYILKILILTSLFLGLRGIKILKRNTILQKST